MRTPHHTGKHGQAVVQSCHHQTPYSPYRYCQLTDWYEGCPFAHGWFDTSAPALLGFDYDITGYCNGNCDGTSVNILAIFGENVKYNTCRNFEWQVRSGSAGSAVACSNWVGPAVNGFYRACSTCSSVARLFGLQHSIAPHFSIASSRHFSWDALPLWQMCAVRGLLPWQASREIVFARCATLSSLPLCRVCVFRPQSKPRCVVNRLALPIFSTSAYAVVSLGFFARLSAACHEAAPSLEHQQGA